MKRKRNKTSTSFISPDTLSNYDINTSSLKGENEKNKELISTFSDDWFKDSNDIKALMHPTSMIKILSSFNSIYDKENENYIDDEGKITYGAYSSNIYLYKILDYIGIKVLYVEVLYDEKTQKNINFLSILNLKKFRNCKKKKKLSYDDIESEYDKLKMTVSPKNVKSGKGYKMITTIDVNNYDLIIKHPSDKKIKIEKKIYINYQKEDNDIFYKSSYLENNKNTHKISIFMCNSSLFLNSTWYNTIIEKVGKINTDYKVGELKYYKIINKNQLKEIKEEEKDKTSYYTSSFYLPYSNEYDVYERGSLHIYTTNKPLKLKIITENLNKPCFSPYLVNNTEGFCWLSSLISSLLYIDKVNIIILSKLLSKIKSDVDFIINFEDTKFEKKFSIENFHKRYIRFVCFNYIINMYIFQIYQYETLLGELWGKKLIKNILYIQKNKETIKQKLNEIISNSIEYKFSQI